MGFPSRKLSLFRRNWNKGFFLIFFKKIDQKNSISLKKPRKKFESNNLSKSLLKVNYKIN